jgi:hemerythrin-like domain-containing protein
MPSSTGDRVDTWEMVVVHRAFRRTFRTAPAWISSVPAGDRARADIVAEHLASVVDGLHHHHSGEDDLLWPILLSRVTLHTELVHRMESQHKQLHVHIDQINELLPGWRVTADVVTGRELAGVFAEASALLDEHLAEEESQVLPLVAEHVTQAEWAALGKRGQESLPKGKGGFIALGELLADASPQERTAFLAMIPAPVRLMWRLFGKGIYQRNHDRLYQGVPGPHPTGIA